MEQIKPGSTMFFGPVTPLEMAAVVDQDEPRSTITPPDDIITRLKLVVRHIYSYSRSAHEDVIGFFEQHGFSIVDNASKVEVKSHGAN